MCTQSPPFASLLHFLSLFVPCTFTSGRMTSPLFNPTLWQIYILTKSNPMVNKLLLLIWNGDVTLSILTSWSWQITSCYPINFYLHILILHLHSKIGYINIMKTFCELYIWNRTPVIALNVISYNSTFKDKNHPFRSKASL